jgi:hypothetical protein
MKNLSVPTVLAVMLAMSQTAAAAEVGQWNQRAGLVTPADRDDVAEIDHNADGMAPGGDYTIEAPASADAPVTSAPPTLTTTPPKPIVKPLVVKKEDSATDVPAPKTAKAKTAPARDIPLIETDNPVERCPDVNYVTGGIGDDERTSIESAKGDYNLHVMSASTGGAFVGDARVVISSNGKEMLNVVAGPLLYVKLPAGKYALDASLGEQKKHQDFTIGGKTPSANVHLGWKVDATVTDK